MYNSTAMLHWCNRMCTCTDMMLHDVRWCRNMFWHYVHMLFDVVSSSTCVPSSSNVMHASNDSVLDVRTCCHKCTLLVFCCYVCGHVNSCCAMWMHDVHWCNINRTMCTCIFRCYYTTYNSVTLSSFVATLCNMFSSLHFVFSCYCFMLFCFTNTSFLIFDFCFYF